MNVFITHPNLVVHRMCLSKFCHIKQQHASLMLQATICVNNVTNTNTPKLQHLMENSRSRGWTSPTYYTGPDLLAETAVHFREQIVHYSPPLLWKRPMCKNTTWLGGALPTKAWGCTNIPPLPPMSCSDWGSTAGQGKPLHSMVVGLSPALSVSTQLLHNCRRPV